MAKSLQSIMKTFMGRAPAIGQYGQIESLAWFPKFVVTVVDLTLTASQSGSYIVNTAATEAEIVITLPAIADGPWVFHVLNSADVTLTITAETADTLITFNNVAADGAQLATASEKIGGGFICVCDGTSAWAIPIGTGGHVQTLTVVDA